jgi:anthranilate synthase component 2
MLLMIDNYDSFTYNLVQYFGELGADVRTFRNDEITIERSKRSSPTTSASRPARAAREAGISVPCCKHFAGKMPLLGVCLGHQAIGEAFGGKVIRAKQVMHGKVSTIETTQEGVFAGLPKHFDVTRYHSLAIERETLPDCLEVTAWTTTARSWACATRRWPSRACSSTPNRSCPNTAMRCWPTSSRRHDEAHRFSAFAAHSAQESAMSITPQEALTRCIEHREIFHDEMLHLMRQIMQGQMSPVMAAAILTGLRVKKETIGEISAAAQVMREFANHVTVRTARTSSTSSAPAATARTPSTSPPRRCSSPPPPARRSPSTATAACRRSRAAPTCSRRWA